MIIGVLQTDDVNRPQHTNGVCIIADSSYAQHITTSIPVISEAKAPANCSNGSSQNSSYLLIFLIIILQ
jgi:hypothetical protein